MICGENHTNKKKKLFIEYKQLLHPPIYTPRPNISPHSVHDRDPLRRVTFHHLVQRRDVLGISLRIIDNENAVGWKSLR